MYYYNKTNKTATRPDEFGTTRRFDEVGSSPSPRNEKSNAILDTSSDLNLKPLRLNCDELVGEEYRVRCDKGSVTT